MFELNISGCLGTTMLYLFAVRFQVQFYLKTGKEYVMFIFI